MNLRWRACGSYEATIRSAGKCRDCAFYLVDITHVDRKHLNPQSRRQGMDCAPLADPGGVAGIAKNRRTRHAGLDLLEQLQPFPGHAEINLSETGGIAARPGEACDIAGAHRIGSLDRKSTRLNSSHLGISYAVFCLKKK